MQYSNDVFIELDSSIYTNNNIDIEVPIDPNNPNIDIIKQVLNEVFDIFNPKDDFYTNPCNKFSYDNSAIPLLLRKNYIL